LCAPIRRTPTSTPFPYTTLFRSLGPPALVMNRSDAFTTSDGCAAATPANESASTSSGALINFFTTSSLYLQGRSGRDADPLGGGDRKSTRLNSSHLVSSYAVFCL